MAGTLMIIAFFALMFLGIPIAYSLGLSAMIINVPAITAPLRYRFHGNRLPIIGENTLANGKNFCPWI